MAFVTIAARDANVSKKGEITSVFDGADFANKVRLPRLLRVEVTGATAVQVEGWLNRVRQYLLYSIVAENALGWRIKIEIDPNVQSMTGVANALKKQFRDYILQIGDDPQQDHPDWEASEVSHTDAEMIVDIAKAQAADLTAIKIEASVYFNQEIADLLHWRKYYFGDAIVDPKVTQGATDEAAAELPGGNLPSDWTHDTITKAAALSVIIDRLP